MDEAFHARLQLDEGAVIGQADDPALDPGADRVLGGNTHPGIGALLLQAERDAAGLAIVLEDHDLDAVADHVDLRWMADAAPRHIGDVEEPVDPAEVHEGAVIRDVLDGAVHELAFGEVRQGPLPALVARLLEQEPAGHDHVAAPLVDLDDLHGEGLADELFGVTHRMQVDLGAWQEGFYADVHHHPALDAADDPAFDNGLLFVDPLQVFPDLHLVRFLFGQDEVTFAVLAFLDVDRKSSAGCERGQLLGREFLGGNDPLGFIADVHDHRVLLDRQDGDRKSTRLNSSHLVISYAVFCLKKKKKVNKYT